MTLDRRPLRLLLVDEHPLLLWGLGKLVQGEGGLRLLASARSAHEALVYAYLRPEVTVLALELAGVCSLELIPALRRRSGGRVLVHAAHADPRLRADAQLFGAAGVVDKAAPPGQLLAAIAGLDLAGGRGSSFATEPPPGPALRPAFECALAPVVESAAGSAAAFAPEFAPESAPDASPVPARLGRLSPLERRLLRELAAAWRGEVPLGGGPPVAIAPLLALYTRLGLCNRLELVRFARAHGLADAT